MLTSLEVENLVADYKEACTTGDFLRAVKVETRLNYHGVVIVYQTDGIVWKRDDD